MVDKCVVWFDTKCSVIISYALFENVIWPNIHPKSSISHKAKPRGTWMTEGRQQAGPNFQTGQNKFITCSFMVIKKNKLVYNSFKIWLETRKRLMTSKGQFH